MKRGMNMKKGIKLSGRFSLLWLLILAAVFYTGLRLVKKAALEGGGVGAGECAEVFAEAKEQTLPPSNKSFLDLIR